MRKRIFIITIALAAMVLCLTSCSGGTGSGQGSAGSSVGKNAGKFQASKELDSNYADTICVVGNWGNFEALDQAAQDFRQYYPNLEVVYSPLSDAEMDIKNRMISGKEIDMYMFSWFNINDKSKAFLWEHALDLSQIGLDLEVLDQDMLRTGYVDGQLKMMPMYRRVYGFMVNEDLLKAHNLAVPKTYDEFLTCCETLKRAGIPPVLVEGTNNLTITYSQHIVAQTMAAEDPDRVMENNLEGKDDLGIVANTLQMMADLTEKGYVHPDSGQIGNEYEGVILRFFEGDIPFVPYNSEFYSGTRKREAKSGKFKEHPFAYSFIPFPGENGYECVYEQLGTLYMGIYDGIEEEKKPYVQELFRYLLSEEGNYTLEHVKNMPSIHVKTGLSDFPYYRELNDEQVFTAGKNGLRLDYLELMQEGYLGYEDGMSAEDYLQGSIDYINSRRK